MFHIPHTPARWNAPQNSNTHYNVNGFEPSSCLLGAFVLKFMHFAILLPKKFDMHKLASLQDVPIF